MRTARWAKSAASLVLSVMMALGGVNVPHAAAAEEATDDKTVVVMSTEKTEYSDGDTVVSTVKIR